MMVKKFMGFKSIEMLKFFRKICCCSQATVLVVFGFLVCFDFASGREIRAVFLSPPKNAPKKAYLFSPGKVLEVELPRRNFSPEVKLSAGELTFAVLSSPPVEGQEIPQSAPLIKIPEDWSRCYLIFVSDAKNQVFPARVLPINASESRFPLGHSRIINASNATVAGDFGGELVKIAPGKIETIKPPKLMSDSEGAYRVKIDCLMKGEEEPFALSRTSWRHDPNSRQILFVVNPPKGKGKWPKIWGVTDRITTESDEP